MLDKDEFVNLMKENLPQISENLGGVENDLKRAFKAKFKELFPEAEAGSITVYYSEKDNYLVGEADSYPRRKFGPMVEIEEEDLYPVLIPNLAMLARVMGYSPEEANSEMQGLKDYFKEILVNKTKGSPFAYIFKGGGSSFVMKENGKLAQKNMTEIIDLPSLISGLIGKLSGEGENTSN